MRPLLLRLLHRVERSGRDEGATLILVLALISIVSIISLAILTLGETSLRASSKTLNSAEQAYDKDAAMQAGVNAIRISDYDNDTALAQECPPLPFAGANLQTEFVVSCQPVAGSGAASGGTGTNANNSPASALLTLGGSGKDGGTGIQRSGSGRLVINGQTYSRSAISNQTGAGNAIELTTGQAFARGACTGTITSTPSVECNTAADPAGSTDPGYSQPTGGLVRREVPDCAKGKDRVVEFEPGYYDDAEGLTDLFDKCKPKKNVFWFVPTSDGTPGKFYFDFKGGESPQFTGSSIWTIDDKDTKVVAGKPLGWDPDDKKPEPLFPGEKPAPDVTGSCESPLDETTNGGVEFIFGGRSQLQILKGNVELCGHYRVNSPPITVFGATSTNPAPPETPQTTLRGSASDAKCDVAFADKPFITYLDDKVASASIPNDKDSTTACVDITGYATSPDAIPEGSVLVNATLAIRHSEGSVADKDLDFEIGLTPTRSGGKQIDLKSAGLEVTSSLETVYTDITEDLFDEVRDNGYRGSTIRYEVQAKKKKAAEIRLDTVQLILDWVPPGVRSQDTTGIHTFSSEKDSYSLSVRTQTSARDTETARYSANGTKESNANCVAQTDFPKNGCAFLATGNTDEAQLFVQGTLYAPLAAVELRQENIRAPVVTTGTIVRKLYFNGLTTATQSGTPVTSVLSTPIASPPSVPLAVNFWSFQCINPDGCPVVASDSPTYPYLADDPLQWQLVGTAKAQYVNGNNFPGQSGNRSIEVLSWQLVSPYERP